MAVNFCQARHSPVISCNKVSSDGYEVSNLVSGDERCRNRGFLAATFITPPVEIVVTFPCSIDISHIVLELSVGAQQTSSCHLYTDTGLINSDVHPNFRLVGAYDNVANPKLSVHNYRYRPKPPFSNFSSPKKEEGSKLYPRQDANVCWVRKLKVCLLRTARSSVPALSKLEVWGQPSRDCDPELKEKIYRTELNARNVLNKLFEENMPCRSICSKDEKTDEHGKSSDMDIPSEFLDSLTYELMAQPILLPSGNNIDKSSLEKYLENSAAWGRPPNDPFTGVPFTRNNQPTSNVELKLRIDQFWLTHPELCTGGRCIGTTKKLKFNLEPFTPKSQRVRLASEHLNQSKHSPFSMKGPTLKRSASRPLPTITKKQKLESNPKHANELRSSLQESLKSVLSGRPSFLNVDNSSKVSEEKKCAACNVKHSYEYTLPCSHLLCRNCLLEKRKWKKFECHSCRLPFTSSDIIRYHD